MSEARRRHRTPEEERALRLALRPLHHFERVKVSCYPVTVSNVVAQALDMGIPEDAELVVHTEYDENGPEVFFQWPVYVDTAGRHERNQTGILDAEPV